MDSQRVGASRRRCLVGLGGLAWTLAGCGGGDATFTSWASLPGAAPPVPHGLRFDVQELGGPLGIASTAAAVNDDGTVVGIAEQAARDLYVPTRGFAVVDGQTIDLGNLGSTNCSPTAINGAGWITGSAGWRRPGEHIFLYRDGGMEDMLPALGIRYGIAYAINAVGHVAGRFDPGNGCAYHAFVLADGVLTEINAFGGFYSVARGINDAGVVTGTGTLGGPPPWPGGCEQGGPLHAFVYAAGEFTDLGTLGGTRSDAWAIDAAGTVVGSSSTEGDQESHACRWQDGRASDLGTLGGNASSARALNAFGDIVGTSLDREGLSRAFLVPAGGEMVDLNSLLDPDSGAGWTLNVGNGINRHLQIAGDGLRDGRRCGFLLTPLL